MADPKASFCILCKHILELKGKNSRVIYYCSLYSKPVSATDECKDFELRTRKENYER